MAGEVPRREPPSPDGVGFAFALLNEVVVEEAHCYQPLLERGVRQANPRVECDDPCAAAVRPLTEVADVVCDRRTIRRERFDPVTVADRQVIRQRPCVSFDSARREAKISLDLQPAERIAT